MLSVLKKEYRISDVKPALFMYKERKKLRVGQVNLQVDLENRTYIFMSHVAKKLNFSECPLGINFVVKCITDLLNGYLLMCI